MDCSVMKDWKLCYRKTSRKLKERIIPNGYFVVVKILAVTSAPLYWGSDFLLIQK